MDNIVYNADWTNQQQFLLQRELIMISEIQEQLRQIKAVAPAVVFHDVDGLLRNLSDLERSVVLVRTALKNYAEAIESITESLVSTSEDALLQGYGLAE